MDPYFLAGVLTVETVVLVVLFVLFALCEKRAAGWRELYFELKDKAYLRDAKGRMARASDVLK